MLRLLVVLFVAVASYGANWEGAGWYTVYSADSAFIENLAGLNCSGDTVYLMPYGSNNRAELIRWSPNDVAEVLDPPFDPIAVYGFNHADPAKKFPALLQGPTLWRLDESGWDSTRIGSTVWWPQCFAVGPDGALHFLMNDSLSEGVIYRRSGGSTPDVDTVFAPCIRSRYVGHWIGVDVTGLAIMAIEEDFPSGEDQWIPCMKVVQWSEASVEFALNTWHTVNRRYFQGVDGRWFVVRDQGSNVLEAETFIGIDLANSGNVLSPYHTFRLAQNPMDSLFEVAGMERGGNFACDIQNEPSSGNTWGNFLVDETPASVYALHFLIDQHGYGHIFVADSNTIYRYGPPPQITPAESRPRLPQEISLSVYPNPGNAEFRLSYSLAKSSDVSLTLFDVTGREVQVLADGVRNAGEHVVNWSANNQPSGVYFAVLNAGDASTVTKMVLMK